MKEALSELRKIAQMPDQKHWKSTEMRERALEEWIYRWITDLSCDQLIVNQKVMSSEFEDMLKEQLFSSMLDQIMEEVAVITKEPNRIKGQMSCFRRKPRS